MSFRPAAPAVMQLPLSRLLPEVVAADDACVARLQEQLRRIPGVVDSCVVLAQDGGPAVQVSYDPSRVDPGHLSRAAADAARQLQRRFRHARLRVGGMDCQACAGSIEHLLARVSGITAVCVDYPSGAAAIEYEPARLRRRDIVRRIEALGYRVDDRPRLGQWLGRHRALVQAAIAGLLTLVGWLHLRAAGPGAPAAAGWLVGAYLLAGWPAASGAWRHLRRGRAGVDLLMVLAAAGAAAIGQAVEGATLLVIFAAGHALEHGATDRAREALRRLADLAPRTARRVQDGEEQEVPLQEVRRGDRLRVLPGERLPVDGRVVAGSGWVDEAAVTGEPLPREKGPGDPVYAGTLNGDAVLVVEATRLSADSTLARMVRLVEEARSRPARAQRLADRMADVLVPAVLAAAALVAVGGPALAGWSWKEGLYRGLGLLVAASPCALAVGPPTAALAALAAAARRGILVKGGGPLEALAGVRAAAFDKTGTLTLGRPRVSRVVAFAGFTQQQVLQLAAAVEQGSGHPLASAVLQACALRNLRPAGPAREVATVRGMGVLGQVGGREVRVGTPAFAAPGTDTPPAGQDDDPSATRLLVSVDGRPAGIIEVQDSLREAAGRVLAALRRAGVRTVALLSGDRAEVARHVAQQLGVDDVMAPLLPDEKLHAVEGLRRRHGSVLVVGDGINDGPALAAATVGVAVARPGSDVALEAADLALLREDLGLLEEAVELSRAFRRVVAQNLAVAGAVMTALVAGVLAGWTGLGLAVFAHEASTLVVVLNSLRLLAWRPAGAGPAADERTGDGRPR